MSNQWDPELPENIKKAVRAVLEQFELDGHRIRYDVEAKSLHFRKGFHEATVLVSLVEQNRWADVRQIFQAVFKEAPQVQNFASTSDWDRGK